MKSRAGFVEKTDPAFFFWRVSSESRPGLAPLAQGDHLALSSTKAQSPRGRAGKPQPTGPAPASPDRSLDGSRLGTLRRLLQVHWRGSHSGVAEDTAQRSGALQKPTVAFYVESASDEHHSLKTLLKKAKTRSLTVTAPKRCCLLAMSCSVRGMSGWREDGIFQQRLKAVPRT